MEQLPSQAKEAIEQLTSDVLMVQASIRRLQVHARRALNQLVDDLSSAAIPKSLYELRKLPVPASFPGRVDHEELRSAHKVFVNPSVSEVLCTTTAEALVTRKFAIIPVHASKTFFLRFHKCLAYRNQYEPTMGTDP